MNSASVFAGICRIDDQRERHGGHKPDRRKVLHGIVRQFLVERLVDGKRGRGRHQQRVAVGLGLCDLVGAERRAGARLVLDNDGRVKPALELVGDQPAEKIGGAARRIGHDHLDGPAGIGRLGLAGEAASHASPPPHPAIACLRVNGMPFSQVNFLLLLRTTIAVTATYQRGRKVQSQQRAGWGFFRQCNSHHGDLIRTQLSRRILALSWSSLDRSIRSRRLIHSFQYRRITRIPKKSDQGNPTCRE